MKYYSTRSNTSKLLYIIKPARHQSQCSYPQGGSVLIASRTYILLHTSNSRTCTLNAELEVQPRLEVCWALDTHRKALIQKASGQHNRDKIKVYEKENSIILFH